MLSAISNCIVVESGSDLQLVCRILDTVIDSIFERILLIVRSLTSSSDGPKKSFVVSRFSSKTKLRNLIIKVTYLLSLIHI